MSLRRRDGRARRHGDELHRRGGAGVAGRSRQPLPALSLEAILPRERTRGRGSEHRGRRARSDRPGVGGTRLSPRVGRPRLGPAERAESEPARAPPFGRVRRRGGRRVSDPTRGGETRRESGGVRGDGRARARQKPRANGGGRRGRDPRRIRVRAVSGRGYGDDGVTGASRGGVRVRDGARFSGASGEDVERRRPQVRVVRGSRDEVERSTVADKGEAVGRRSDALAVLLEGPGGVSVDDGVHLVEWELGVERGGGCVFGVAPLELRHGARDAEEADPRLGGGRAEREFGEQPAGANLAQVRLGDVPSRDAYAPAARARADAVAAVVGTGLEQRVVPAGPDARRDGRLAARFRRRPELPSRLSRELGGLVHHRDRRRGRRRIAADPALATRRESPPPPGLDPPPHGGVPPPVAQQRAKKAFVVTHAATVGLVRRRVRDAAAAVLHHVAVLPRAVFRARHSALARRCPPSHAHPRCRRPRPRRSGRSALAVPRASSRGFLVVPAR